jgi:excisionase family DNA binding protein
MTTSYQGRTLVSPSPLEAKAADESRKMLAKIASENGGGFHLAVKNGQGTEELNLPAPAAQLLMDVLQQLGQGNAVALNCIQPELTTQQAADLLNITCVDLIELLDDGTIPSRKVGVLRKVLREDVLAYKQVYRAQQMEALRAMVALHQELGLE